MICRKMASFDELTWVVAGMLQGSFGTHVRIRQTIIQHVPAHMTVEAAVTVITAFLTAWIGLVSRARLRRGETALIHSGAGGVGQAAIQICQHLGVEVYTTVGSVAKKDLLMERYRIPGDHIFNSRDGNFAQGVMRMTKRRGVDVVLNSLSGEFLRQSWHCLADFGRFIEIGKRDLLGNTGLDMQPFLRGVSYMVLISSSSTPPVQRTWNCQRLSRTFSTSSASTN